MITPVNLMEKDNRVVTGESVLTKNESSFYRFEEIFEESVKVPPLNCSGIGKCVLLKNGNGCMAD